MKPYRLTTIFAALGITAILLALTSCSDTDTLPELKKTTFSGTSLQLYYDGEAMAGKYIDFTPSTDGLHANLILGGEFDLSALPQTGLHGKLEAPGILPGSPKFPLTVALNPAGDHYVFSGAASSQYISFKYNGIIRDGKLQMEIQQPRLLKAPIAPSVWKLCKPQQSAGEAGFTSSPFHIVWNVENPALITGVDLPLGDLLQLILNIPAIPVYHDTAYMSMAQLANQMLATVAFNENGNIPVRYWSAANGAKQLMTANTNTLQYVILSPSDMRVFINPLQALGIILTNGNNGYTGPENVSWSISTKSAANSRAIDEMMNNMIAIASSYFASGIPQTYKLTSDKLSVYADTAFAKSVMTDVITPLLEDPNVQAAIMNYLKSNGNLAKYAEMAEQVIGSLPVLIQNTTQLELGFNFAAAE